MPHRQNPKSVNRLFQNVKKLEYTWEKQLQIKMVTMMK